MCYVSKPKLFHQLNTPKSPENQSNPKSPAMSLNSGEIKVIKVAFRRWVIGWVGPREIGVT